MLRCVVWLNEMNIQIEIPWNTIKALYKVCILPIVYFPLCLSTKPIVESNSQWRRAVSFPCFPLNWQLKCSFSEFSLFYRQLPVSHSHRRMHIPTHMHIYSTFMLYGRNIVCAHIESLPVHGFLFLLARCVCVSVRAFTLVWLCVLLT